MVNASFPTVLDWLSRASIGLSTMVDEHFGINIIEFMVCLYMVLSLLGSPSNAFVRVVKAAGIIPVAHASGGPLCDIIVPFNGKPTGTSYSMHDGSLLTEICFYRVSFYYFRDVC